MEANGGFTFREEGCHSIRRPVSLRVSLRASLCPGVEAHYLVWRLHPPAQKSQREASPHIKQPNVTVGRAGGQSIFKIYADVLLLRGQTQPGRL